MEFLAVVMLLVVCGADYLKGDSSKNNLAFMTSRWPLKLKFKQLYDTVTVSCKTNTADAKVYLYKRYNLRDVWRNIDNTGRRIKVTKEGQSFRLKNVGVKDSGYYKCVAENWRGRKISLEKGQLVVSPVGRSKPPRIYPNTPVLKIEEGSNRNITCRGVRSGGTYSFVTWYKRANNGELKRVDNARIHDSFLNYRRKPIDVKTLQIRDFGQKDVGVYVCKQVRYGGSSTEAEVKVEAKPVFEFKTPKWHIGQDLPIKIALISDFAFISCQTSSPHAEVRLLRRRGGNSPWSMVGVYEVGRIKQVGQIFIIQTLSFTDSAFYKCRATYRGKTIEMEKGMLLASIVELPTTKDENLELSQEFNEEDEREQSDDSFVIEENSTIDFTQDLKSMKE